MLVSLCSWLSLFMSARHCQVIVGLFSQADSTRETDVEYLTIRMSFEYNLYWFKFRNIGPIKNGMDQKTSTNRQVTDEKYLRIRMPIWISGQLRRELTRRRQRTASFRYLVLLFKREMPLCLWAAQPTFLTHAGETTFPFFACGSLTKCATLGPILAD